MNKQIARDTQILNWHFMKSRVHGEYLDKLIR